MCLYEFSVVVVCMYVCMEQIQQNVHKLGSKLNERREAMGLSSLLPYDMVVVSVKATLRRFLKAREIDVDRAYDMVTDTISWREENEMDRILDEPLEEELYKLIVERYPGYYCGFDKDGFPVYYEWTPGVQWLELLDRVGFAESIRLHYKLMEFQSRVLCLKATNRVSNPDAPAANVRDKCVNVLDMHGLSLSLLWDKRITEVLTHVSKIDQDHYPELLRRAYIINAPLAFKAAFAIVKPFLSKSTQEKIRVLGSKKESLDAVKIALGEKAKLPSLIYHQSNSSSANSETDASVHGLGEPANAVVLLQEFLRHRAKRLESRRRTETAAMIEQVADPLLTPTHSYEILKESTRSDGSSDDNDADGNAVNAATTDDAEDTDASIRGEDETYQALTNAALLSSERSFRVMVKVDEVARKTSEHMAIHASSIPEDEVVDEPMPTIEELTKQVSALQSTASSTWEAKGALLSANNVLTSPSSAAGMTMGTPIELTSNQSNASVLLLSQFCKQSAMMYGIYGALLMLATIFSSFVSVPTAEDVSLVVIILGIINGGGQLMLAYHVYAAAYEFQRAYMERSTHWHIEMVGMVRYLIVCAPHSVYAALNIICDTESRRQIRVGEMREKKIFFDVRITRGIQDVAPRPEASPSSDHQLRVPPSRQWKWTTKDDTKRRRRRCRGESFGKALVLSAQSFLLFVVVSNN